MKIKNSSTKISEELDFKSSATRIHKSFQSCDKFNRWCKLEKKD